MIYIISCILKCWGTGIRKNNDENNFNYNKENINLCEVMAYKISGATCYIFNLYIIAYSYIFYVPLAYLIYNWYLFSVAITSGILDKLNIYETGLFTKEFYSVFNRLEFYEQELYINIYGTIIKTICYLLFYITIHVLIYIKIKHLK